MFGRLRADVDLLLQSREMLAASICTGIWAGPKNVYLSKYLTCEWGRRASEGDGPRRASQFLRNTKWCASGQWTRPIPQHFAEVKELQEVEACEPYAICSRGRPPNSCPAARWKGHMHAGLNNPWHDYDGVSNHHTIVMTCPS